MIAKPLISLIATIDFKDKVSEFIAPFFDPQVGKEGYQIIVVEDVGFKYPFVKKHEQIITNNGCEIQIIRLNRTSRAKKRNEAILQSSSNILLLFAGDFIPLPETIQSHLQFHTLHPANNKVAIGPGLFVKEARSPLMEWSEETGKLFGLPFLEYKTEQPVDFFYGANASLKKDFLLSAGPFDERFLHDSCDDYDMWQRLKKLNMESWVVPSAAAIHEHDVTIEQRKMLLEQAGKSSVLLDLKYPDNIPWINERTISIPALEEEAKLNYKKYQYSNEINYLHKYFELISRIAFCKGYQREIQRTGRILRSI
jgi:hypothetical protein